MHKEVQPTAVNAEDTQECATHLESVGFGDNDVDIKVSVKSKILAPCCDDVPNDINVSDSTHQAVEISDVVTDDDCHAFFDAQVSRKDISDIDVPDKVYLTKFI